MARFSKLFLAASLCFTAWLAYWRYTHGLPALQDFRALTGAGSLPAIRPPFYRPLSGLPFETAAILWLALNAAAGLGFGLWAIRRVREPAMALLFAVFLPSIVSLSVGQDSLLMLAALTGVFLLLEDERPLPAGLLLSLLWAKFHLLPVFVLMLVVRRAWRAIGGFAIGSAILLGPIASQIPGYLSYLAEVAAHPSVMPCRACMPNLHALVPNAATSVVLSAGLLAATIPRLRGPLPQAFSLAATSALLVSHHAIVYDCVLLFLAAVLAKDQDPDIAWLWAWTISPMPYLLAYVWEPLRVAPSLTVCALWAVQSVRTQRHNSGSVGRLPYIKIPMR